MQRYAQRFAEESVRRHILAHLDTLGWTCDDPTVRPSGAGQTTVSSTLTGVEGTDPNASVAVGDMTPKVGVSLTSHAPDDETEVGGVLAETRYDLFVSVLAHPSLAVSLAEDIVDLLAGRTARPVVTFYDFTKDPPTTVVGETLQLEDVSSGQARPGRRDWLVISATLVRDFSRSWV